MNHSGKDILLNTDPENASLYDNGMFSSTLDPPSLFFVELWNPNRVIAVTYGV